VASGATSVISGGQNNTASGELSVIAGGSGSIASGKGSAVGGGENNTASGLFATVPGGRNNLASGENSFAVGRRARAVHAGSVVFGDNTDVDKNSSGDNQFLIQATGGVGINSAPVSGVALTVSGRVKANIAEFDSMNVATLSATTVSGYGTVPLGGIIIWSGAENAVPAGWALCNGQISNGRNTPNLQGRFVIGSGWGASWRGVGTTGGAETVTLSVAQLPAHNHVVSGSTAHGGEHTHPFRAFNANFEHKGSATEGSTKNDSDGDFTDYDAVRSAGAHSHGINLTSTSTGSGQAIDKMPPFYALAYIMRVQ
jgi:microcystin-dependent protein